MLQNMKGQFAEHLMHAGFVSSPDPKDSKSNVNSGEAVSVPRFFFLFHRRRRDAHRVSPSSRQREVNQGCDRRGAVPEGGRHQTVVQQKETRVSTAAQAATGSTQTRGTEERQPLISSSDNYLWLKIDVGKNCPPPSFFFFSG